MTNQPTVSVRDFRKRYGSFVAVDGISFEAGRGEIFGLLGPNGAGKTTTLECLEGIRQSDDGSLAVLGVDPGRQPRKLRNLIGVQLQSSGLPGDMTVDEAMRFFCAYHGVPPRYDLLDRLGLQPKRRTQYRELSTGLQRRVALALAISHNPPVVILDEPTAGLDVGSRTELHALMQELRDGGTALILATHDMAEAEKLADRVAILLRGKIVAAGTPRELHRRRFRSHQNLGAHGGFLPCAGWRLLAGCESEVVPGGLRDLPQHGPRAHRGCDPRHHQSPR